MDFRARPTACSLTNTPSNRWSSMSTNPREEQNDAYLLDAVIVGAGFAGMYMLYRLRNLGMSARVFEAGDGVGGTWFWNRYPGARCDTESIEYSYSFSDEIQQEWEWSERYPTQPEILRYANWVAEKLDLKRDIELNTRVDRAIFDEDAVRWRIEMSTGQTVIARYCIMATGCLSTSQIPHFDGLQSFQGNIYHTGRWPHEGVEFSGQRVGIIGTGSSAIQSIPIIAEQAEHLFVFQRTPNYSVPAHNGPLDPDYVRKVKNNYNELREQARTSRRGYMLDVSPTRVQDVSIEQRDEVYQYRWNVGGLGFMSSFGNLLSDQEANDTAAEFVRDRIRDIVEDQDVAEKLLPTDYPIGTKRLCIDSHYYETFNRDNVTLIDIKSAPIVEITPGGIRTAESEFPVDSIVFATGFDAMTGTLKKIDIRGVDGIELRDKWENGPITYLGLAVSGYPNLFLITGPGSPSVLSNMIVSIEQHVEWITDCIQHLKENGIARIEANPDAEISWTDHVNEVAGQLLYAKGNSWWKGANIPGKPVVFMPYTGGVGRYRGICDQVAASGYEGFTLTPEAARTSASLKTS
jgi:cyclohexanone monooxygenase